MLRLLDTDASWRSLVQRVVVGVVILAHGLQKIGVIGGGSSFSQAAHGLAGATHLPLVFGVLAVLAETAGAVLLITGLLTRLGALGISCVMIGAIATVHAGNGFFMNWMGTKPGEGYEYHLIVLAMSVPLIVTGGGLWSIDRAIARLTGRYPQLAHSRA